MNVKKPIIFCLLMVLLSACKKEYTCTCLVNSAVVEVYTVYDNYDNASKSCQDFDKNAHGNDPNNEYYCEIR